MHDNIKEHQDKLKASLLSSYSEESKNSILKSEESEIEKSGEGSKGGKIIGHTKSGKPVYANTFATHDKYKNFTSEDHEEASHIHMNSEDSKMNMQERDEHSADHSRQTKEYKLALEERKKKSIKKSEDEENGLEGTISLDGKYIRKSEGWVKLEVSEEENDLEKGGEGSKGGKIVGHTKSGKAIYANHNHTSHNDFSPEEHLEAARNHGRKSNEATNLDTMVQHSKAAVHHWEQHYDKGGNHKDPSPEEKLNLLKKQFPRMGKTKEGDLYMPGDSSDFEHIKNRAEELFGIILKPSSNGTENNPNGNGLITKFTL